MKTTRETRTETELARLAEIFQELPEEKLAVVQPLIENAAFMKTTLEDLQEQIQKEGPVEIYTNGANQSGKKQSAAVQAYNAIMKNYTAVIKTLSAMIPRKKETPTLSWRKPDPEPEEEEYTTPKSWAEYQKEYEEHQARVAAGLEEPTPEEKECERVRALLDEAAQRQRGE